MDELKKLLADAKAKRDEALKSSQEADKELEQCIVMVSGDAPDMKAVNDLEAKATSKKKLALQRLEWADKDIERLQKDILEKSTPVVPGSMPGELNGGTYPNAPVTPKDDSPEQIQQKAIQASYQMRYGTMDAQVKAVIDDMHGPNYYEDRDLQRKAFFMYVRGKERDIDSRGWKLLKTFIPTEIFIKKAIEAGWDTKHIKSTMVEAIDTLGGYTVPVDFQERIIERLPGFTVMRGRSQQQDTMRDVVQFPKTTGGDDQYVGNVRVTWVDETPSAVSVSETNATFGMEEVPVNTMMAVVPLSKNLLEDSVFNLSSYLERQFGMAKAISEDNAFLVGNGTGKPKGVIVGGTTLTTGVASVNSGAAAALTFNGVIAMTFGIASQYKNNAVWVANRATYQAIAQLVDNEGNYLWTELRGNNAVGAPKQLRGYDVLEQEGMPDIGAGAYPLLFGNLSGYMIIDRVGMTVEKYNISPGQNQLFFEMRSRVGGQVIEPWQLAAQLVSA